MLDLNEKTAVITGGATGIGFALAKNMGNLGARVVIAEPREDKLQTAVHTLVELGIDARYKVCDVTREADVEALADYAWSENGQVDIAINNAGIGQPRGGVMSTRADDIRATLEVNFFGVWHGCRVFAERMAKQGTPARIYNTGSENSFFVAAPGMAGYVASKHAVLGLTEALSEEVPDFIKVGMIVPGFVNTDLTSGFGELAMGADEFAGIIVPQIQAGEPFAVSHAYNMERIDHRYASVSQAYANYAPRYDGDEEYDVRTLLERLSDQR